MLEFRRQYDAAIRHGDKASEVFEKLESINREFISKHKTLASNMPKVKDTFVSPIDAFRNGTIHSVFPSPPLRRPNFPTLCDPTLSPDHQGPQDGRT